MALLTFILSFNGTVFLLEDLTLYFYHKGGCMSIGVEFMILLAASANFTEFESGSERIPRSLLRGKRANGEHYYSLWIEASP
jgi:hypothetical protein